MPTAFYCLLAVLALVAGAAMVGWGKVAEAEIRAEEAERLLKVEADTRAQVVRELAAKTDAYDWLFSATRNELARELHSVDRQCRRGDRYKKLAAHYRDKLATLRKLKSGVRTQCD